MKKQEMNRSIDGYINQFDYEIKNEKTPTKKGYMQHMNITKDDLKGNDDRSNLLNLGLTKVAVFLEQGLFIKDSNKLNRIMAELVNSFGYQY